MPSSSSPCLASARGPSPGMAAREVPSRGRVVTSASSAAFRSTTYAGTAVRRGRTLRRIPSQFRGGAVQDARRGPRKRAGCSGKLAQKFAQCARRAWPRHSRSPVALAHIVNFGGDDEGAPRAGIRWLGMAAPGKGVETAMASRARRCRCRGATSRPRPRPSARAPCSARRPNGACCQPCSFPGSCSGRSRPRSRPRRRLPR